MDKKLKGPLQKAIEVLEEQGYRYAVIGGVAVAQWGFPRATNDIDIKVLVPNTDYAGVRAALLSRFPERARLKAPENPFIVAVTIDKVIVDFLLTLPGYEEQIIERAVLRDLGGISAWVCSVEDLIIQKVVAGREKDWLDLEALLLEQLGKLDESFINNWLAQFAEALEKPEILTKYRQLVERIKALR
ncbi:MAG: nucleotidyltransferase [bacterium]